MVVLLHPVLFLLLLLDVQCFVQMAGILYYIIRVVRIFRNEIDTF